MKLHHKECNGNQICFFNSRLCEDPSSCGGVENGLENDLSLKDTSQKTPVCPAGLGFSLSICCLLFPDGRITEHQPLAALMLYLFQATSVDNSAANDSEKRPVGVLSLHYLLCLSIRSSVI